MNTSPRYTRDESHRDMRDALVPKLDARTVVVEPYYAVGSTSARVPISCSKLPAAVQLVGAALFFDLGAPLTLTPTFNFVWDAGTQTAQVFEPSGLTANVAYRLTYLVIGG